MAERVVFEPTVRARAQRFSRPPRSTTPAPLRIEKHNIGNAATRPGRFGSAAVSRWHRACQAPFARKTGESVPAFPCPGRVGSHMLRTMDRAAFFSSQAGRPISVPLRAKDRKSVVSGKSVSVRVDLGGGRIL